MLNLDSELSRDIDKRIVSNFMDVLILAHLRDGPKSGYDIIALIHSRFDVVVSPGTVYSVLYSMERDGLVRGRWIQRKRLYDVTDKGNETVEGFLNGRERILGLMAKLFVKLGNSKS